jgi:hypothetical protein
MTGIKCVLCVALLFFAELALGQTDVNSQDGSGQLVIQGTHITKLVFESTTRSNRKTITDPGQTVFLPEGSYRVKEIHLQGGYVFDSDRGSLHEEIVIDKNTPCTLTAGGPLMPSIHIQRQGRQLQLSYQRQGIGQELYNTQSIDRAKAPTFTVYDGKVVIDTGTFEYG